MNDMEFIENESKPGLYDVYLTQTGKKLIVLEGLAPSDGVISPPLQQKIHAHYETIAFLYWIIFGCTLIYLFGLYVVIPLMRRYGLY